MSGRSSARVEVEGPEVAEWEALYDSCRRLVPPEQWRLALARELSRLTGCDVALGTCPPGNLPQSELVVWPPESSGYALRAIRDFVPRMVRQAGWEARLARYGTLYAGHRDFDGQAVTRQLHDQVLSPEGITGYVVAFASAQEDGPPVAWTVLWCREPAEVVLERYRGPLRRLIEVVGKHVGGVMSLAQAFGVQPAGGWQRLSTREQQIAQLVAQGNSNLNVAQQVGIAESTVAVHLRRIYKKLGIHSRTQLARAVMSLTVLIF